jgi:hypothetical protein
MSSAKRRRTDRTFFQQLDEFDLASLACARCRTRKVKVRRLVTLRSSTLTCHLMM